jgi:hypothetical protein
MLDLNRAYHQILLAESSKPLTAFCTECGLYQYRCVSFWIVTGAQVLTRLLNVIIHCHTQMCTTTLRSSCSLQLQFTQHLQHLDEVFTRLCKAGLTAKPSKVAFAVQMVLFWATEYPIQVHRLSRSALGP